MSLFYQEGIKYCILDFKGCDHNEQLGFNFRKKNLVVMNTLNISKTVLKNIGKAHKSL